MLEGNIPHKLNKIIFINTSQYLAQWLHNDMQARLQFQLKHVQRYEKRFD